MSVQCTDNGLCPILDVRCHLDLYSVYELSLLCVTYIFNITQTMLCYEIKAVGKICKTQTIPRKLCTSLDLVCVKVNSVRLSHALISPLTILRASGGTQLTCGVAQVVVRFPLLGNLSARVVVVTWVVALARVVVQFPRLGCSNSRSSRSSSSSSSSSSTGSGCAPETECCG